MHNVTEKSVELTIRAQGAVTDLVQGAKTRLSEQRGQAGAEYAGILVLIGLIFVALFALGLDTKIKNAVEGAIGDILNTGGGGNGGGGGGGGNTPE